jgi:tetratricopeptide (TPR) repeat protein
MLTRVEMVATKIPLRKVALICLVTALALQPGCAPPGPRALLEGEDLLNDGKPDKAIVELKRATELLPGEPRAWNLLGLAYHRSGQVQLATLAYRQALVKDRSNVAAVAHYNLGCLLLEQNFAVGAAESLRSFTLITNSAVGWARLGSAQLRLRQFADAEKSFLSSLRVQTNAEALNGLGVTRAQRGQRDAAQYFTAALQVDPKFSPALLNSAVLAQQIPATRPVALQRYRDYLAARRNDAHAETVKMLARQLEAELSPPPPTTAANTGAAPKLNVPTNSSVAVVTNRIAPAIPAKSNVLAAVTKTNQVATTVTNKPAPTVVSIPITVVAVTNQAPARIAAAEIPASKPIAPAPMASVPPPAVTEETPEIAPGPATPSLGNEKKPGLFSRLNPFGGKSRPDARDASRTVVAYPETAPSPSEAIAGMANAKPVFPRYEYVSPARPGAGHRNNADRALRQAMTAQRQGRTSEATAAYAASINADPSYFEAQYNAALFAFQSGELARALVGWETALALQPDSMGARYSFALALKQAGYCRDAALELERIVEAKPDDARSHLALGNLYAQQLMEADKARTHYKKLLELDPRNAQASAIRFWLAGNP